MSESTAISDYTVPPRAAEEVRARIVAAAVSLIAVGGRDAVTTRAVAAAAGVQPPAIYRQFGDMRGLLDAAAREALAAYVSEKATRTRSSDPVEDLRRGWDLHVAFGLANPAVYALIYGDPTGGTLPTAAREGEAHLHALVARVAAAGRLRVGVAHAARLIAAAGNGVTLALLAATREARDVGLADAMREAVLAAITVAPTSDDSPYDVPQDAAPDAARVTSRALALRVVLGETPYETSPALSPAERNLLGEWLDRLAGGDV